MTNNKGIGVVFGAPISRSDFKFDSSGYSVFYVCEVPLLKKNALTFHYLIGQKITGELLLTIDRNFNNSFLDDSVITINKNECNNCDFSTLQNCVTLSAKYLNGSADDLTLHIVARCCMKNFTTTSDNRFLDTMNVAFEAPFEKIGDFSNSDSKFQISLQNRFPKTNYSEKNNIKLTIKDLHNVNDSSIYRVDDTVRMGRAFYKIQSLSKNADTITLQTILGEAQPGYKVGYYAYNFKEKDISTGKFIGLADFSNKYLLIEYWGTWCGPCVGLHDDIVNLLKTNDGVSYLGVAFDTDVERVKNYLLESPSMRRQLFAKMNNKEATMIGLYRVENYPTFILIKKGGEIVFRDYGIEGFKKLNAFLNAHQ